MPGPDVYIIMPKLDRDGVDTLAMALRKTAEMLTRLRAIHLAAIKRKDARIRELKYEIECLKSR
jgi:hypothetical protein